MTSLEGAAIIGSGLIALSLAIVAKCRFRIWEDSEGEHHWSSGCWEREGNVAVLEHQLGAVPILIVYQRQSSS